MLTQDDKIKESKRKYARKMYQKRRENSIQSGQMRVDENGIGIPGPQPTKLTPDSVFKNDMARLRRKLKKQQE